MQAYIFMSCICYMQTQSNKKLGELLTTDIGGRVLTYLLTK